MVWCGVVIFPAFGVLDYLLVPDWKLFVIARLIISFCLVLILVFNKISYVKGLLMAHLSTQLVFQTLMWMLSQLPTTELFFIYSLNACTAFIASAVFLLWKIKHSVFLFLSSLASFTLFYILFSPLTPLQIISNGALLMFSIMLVVQIYVYYRYKLTCKDYHGEQFLKEVNQELRFKNFKIEQQNVEIQKQKENLEELNALKDKLIFIVSHDFRSPLQSLKGVLSLMENSANLSPAEFSQLASGIRHQVDSTYTFLENLLMWAKSQMNGVQTRFMPLNLRELNDENMGLLSSYALQKKISIRNEVNPNHFGIGDMDMVRLVLRNLLTNAIKFSDVGGLIIIRSELKGEEVIVSVKDYGMGMSPDELESLFVTTKTISKMGTLMEKGTGMGLMLCKEFVEKNNGFLGVSSEAGNGSCFSFSLKKHEVAAMEAHAV